MISRYLYWCECRANGGKYFDNNHRPRFYGQVAKKRSRLQQKMLECTDIAFPTLDDEDALWGQQPVEEVIARNPCGRRAGSGGKTRGGLCSGLDSGEASLTFRQ